MSFANDQTMSNVKHQPIVCSSSPSIERNIVPYQEQPSYASNDSSLLVNPTNRKESLNVTPQRETTLIRRQRRNNSSLNSNKMNPSWNNQQAVQTAPHSSAGVQPSASMPSKNHGNDLQGLLALLQRNQPQGINSSGTNLIDCINLLINTSGNANNSQPQPLPPLQTFQQQEPQLSALPYGPSSTATPPPPPMQFCQFGNQQQQQDHFGEISRPQQLQSGNDGGWRRENQELHVLLKNLQNQVSQAAPMSSPPLGGIPTTGYNSVLTNMAPPAGMSQDDRLVKRDSLPQTQSLQSSKASNTITPVYEKKVKTNARVRVMPNSAVPPQPVIAGNTKGKEILLYRDIDDFYLTEYQCLLRQQIELFEATLNDVQASAQGRNSPIEVGQVGIRCKYCANLHIKCRSRGAVYFPRSIDGIYQVAQNLTKIHLCQGCKQVPENIKHKLVEYSKVNKRASGGKRYWNERVRELGIYEDGKGIRFKKKTSA